MVAGLGVFSQASAGPRIKASTEPADAAIVETDVAAAHPSVSGDGRYLVYEGRPTDGSERQRTVFLRDAAAPLVEGQSSGDLELTVPVDGVRLGESMWPVISGDGCVVAVVTQMAFDLFRDDDSGNRYDVYSLVLPQCEGGDLTDWQLVSSQSSSDGDTRALDRVVPDEPPAINQSGTVIVVHPPGPFEQGRGAGRQHRRPHQGAGQRGPQHAGRRHADAGAEHHVPVPRPARAQRVERRSLRVVHVRCRQRSVGARVGRWAHQRSLRHLAGVPVGPSGSRRHHGGQARVAGRSVRRSADGAQSSVVSGNGQFVAFMSASADLAGDATLPQCTATCPAQIYRYDQVTLSSTLVSRENTVDGQQWVAAAQGGSQPTISDDGTQVGFVTRSRNLFPTLSAAGTYASDGDIVVSEVDRGIVRRVSTLADGLTPAPAVHSHPALSGSGHVIVFDTLASSAFTGVDAVGRQVVSVARSPQLSAPTLDVGTVAITYPGPEWYVGIRNEGPSTFMPATVESSNPNFAVTGGTCGLGLPVASGQTCTVYVVLTPTVANVITSKLTVSEAQFGGVSITTDLRGAGGEPALRHSSGEGNYPTHGSRAQEPVGVVRDRQHRVRAHHHHQHRDHRREPRRLRRRHQQLHQLPAQPGRDVLDRCAVRPHRAGLPVGHHQGVDVARPVHLDRDGGRRHPCGRARQPPNRRCVPATTSASAVRASGRTRSSASRGPMVGARRSPSPPTTTVRSWRCCPPGPTERSGVRTLVAQSVDAVAKVDVEVLRRPATNQLPMMGG